jgi:hypothetical protein
MPLRQSRRRGIFYRRCDHEEKGSTAGDGSRKIFSRVYLSCVVDISDFQYSAIHIYHLLQFYRLHGYESGKLKLCWPKELYQSVPDTAYAESDQELGVLCDRAHVLPDHSWIAAGGSA